MSLSVLSMGSKSTNRVVPSDSEFMLKSLSDDHELLKHINTLYDLNTDEYSMLDQTHMKDMLQQPKYVKVYKKSKSSGKMFQRLFFAQEMKPEPDDISPIWAMKFSKDGKYLALGRQDGSIVIWKVISSPLSRLESQLIVAPNNRNRSLSTSSSSTAKANISIQSTSSMGANDIGPDRSVLTCPESSYTIGDSVFAPIFESKPVRVLKGHSSAIISLDWSKNNFLISSSMDNSARLWHVDRGESLQLFQHDEFVTSVNFHPTDDRFFLSACMDSRLRLWSILDGEVSFEKKLPGLITTATFAPDGETCIAGGLGWCSVHETRGLDRRYEFQIKGSSSSDLHGPKITGIELYDEMKNGRKSTKLLITSNDSRIRKFNLITRTMETKFKGSLNDHSQIVASKSEDNSFLISGSENHWCYIWSLSEEGHLSNKVKAKETLKKIFGNNQKHNSTYDSNQPSEVPTYKNSSYLVFHANHTDVTCALFAPVATSKLLELSHDPLFELYTNYKLCVKNKLPYDDDVSSVMSTRDFSTSLSSPIPLHRNTVEDEIHPEFSFIVTADKNGNIRVFRRDFVYNIRKALRHDFHIKYKGKKIENGDETSLLSLHPQSSHIFPKDESHHSFITKRPGSIDTDSFLPLGLGSFDQDDYSLSSDCSVEIGARRSHTAKERPIHPVGTENAEPAVHDLHIDDARGRQRGNSNNREDHSIER